jgi:hypothetical protein
MPNNPHKAVGIKSNVQYAGLLLKNGKDEILRRKYALLQAF